MKVRAFITGIVEYISYRQLHSKDNGEHETELGTSYLSYMDHHFLLHSFWSSK